MSGPRDPGEGGNRLAGATSPYLLQHADNPVHWLPWGPEAFARARAEDRPVLLSVGYAACHWCHVMAHESFEDEATAELMNRHFVNVKVDREERPDVDAVYMGAVQAMTGQGGWPMTVVLTPEGEPFFAGTYFPKEDRFGQPAFRRVLRALIEAWEERRDEVRASAGRVRAHLAQALALPPREGEPDEDLFEAALAALEAAFDARHGGFGAAPKFPPHAVLAWLLRRPEPAAERLAVRTLDAMADGGLYDQLGGGFARYSVDAAWAVPHFEKMLYDNAQLVAVYAEAAARLPAHPSAPRWRAVVEETLAWVAREMTLPGGGFASALDADSEGEEGRYYVWTPEEVERAAGPDAEAARRAWGVREVGNFEGRSVLARARTPAQVAAELGLEPAEAEAALARARAALLAARDARVRPGRDDKVLTSWNGLMIGAHARAARLLGRPEWLGPARAAARFLRAELATDGRLLHAWRAGRASVGGLLEDRAFLGLGLLELYRASWEPEWLAWGLELAEDVAARFVDDADGGFFATADDAEALIVRPKELFDGGTPSTNAAAALLLGRAARWTGRAEWDALAGRAIAPLLDAARRHPQGFGTLLLVADERLRPPREVAVVGPRGREDTEALLAALAARPLPGVAVAHAAGEDAPPAERVPFLRGRGLVEGRAAAYVCENAACRLPVTDAAAMLAQLPG